MADSNSSSSIIINIDLNTDPRDANEFSDPSKIIQRDGWKKMASLIGRNLASIKQELKPDQGRPSLRSTAPHVITRRHDVISLHGQRGSGKTTFILNVLAAIEKNEAFCKLIGAEVGEIRSLGLMDPTLIETKEHIIVSLLSRIKQEVDCRRDCLSSDYRADSADYVCWEESLRKLAEGLCLLDGIGKDNAYGEDWQDAQYILDRGLSHASSGSSFEALFHDFIRQSLKFLKKSAFILAFDDIDTKFDRGWPVLETIRKYLTTPQLIIILSGDMDLYSMLVRGQQWHNFGEPLIKQEQWLAQNGSSLSGSAASTVNARMGSLLQMVDKLEGQYLLKVLKPENRIDLAPLRRYADPQNGRRILVRASVDVEAIDLTVMLEELAAKALAMRSPTEQVLFRDLILRQPTRTVLQLLYGTRSLFSKDASHAQELASDIQDGFRNTFATHLLARGLSPDDIREIDARRLVLVLVDWLTLGHGWEHDYRLRPEHRDDNLNLAIVPLSAALVQEFQRSPGAMIDYLIKVSRPHEWISQYAKNQEVIKEYVDFTGLNASETPLQAIRKSAAWERSFAMRNIDRRLHSGLAAVPARKPDENNRALSDLYGLTGNNIGAYAHFPKLEPKRISNIMSALKTAAITTYLGEIEKIYPKQNTRPSYLHYFINSIDTLTNNLSGSARLVASIPYFLIRDKAGAEYGFYSIDPIIAIIGEILSVEILSSEEEKIDEIKRTLRARIWEILRRASLKRTYPTPTATEAGRLAEEESSKSSTKPSEEADEEYPPTEDVFAFDDSAVVQAEDADDVEDLVKVLVQWRIDIEMRGGITPEAPTTLARVWKRFAYNVANVESHLKHLETRYLGVFMHRCAVAFLNALLVETVVATEKSGTNGQDKNLILTNPVTSSSIFYNNILYASSNEATLSRKSLFWAIYSCPLWGFFLITSNNKNEKSFNELLILKNQIEQWESSTEQIERTPKDVIAATYTPMRRGADAGGTLPDQESVKFRNLFDPLNSVYIQGGPPLKHLKHLPLEKTPPSTEDKQEVKPRRGRPPIGYSPSSSGEED